MNYQQIHDRIVAYARQRNWRHRRYHRTGVSPQRYVEAHHVIPRSAGGMDNDSNVIVVTPKEHYVLHHLLVKINPTRNNWYGLAAMRCTRGGRKLSASQADVARDAMSQARRGKLTTDQLEKQRAVHLGGKRPQETCERISASKVGQTPWNKGKEMSEQHRAAMRVPKTLTYATCPHCGKVGARHGMSRYHFDNCKHR